MKYLFLLLPLLLNATYVTKQQLSNLQLAYHTGQQLIINGEPYGKSLAALTLTESSAGLFLTGDAGKSFGLVHMQLPRARELLAVSAYYSGLRSLSDAELSNRLRTDHQLNLVLAGLNLKLNIARWQSYSKAIRAHNGYAPSRGIYNMTYYRKFIANMRVVEQILGLE